MRDEKACVGNRRVRCIHVVAFYNRLPIGGHFAAWEQPEPVPPPSMTKSNYSGCIFSLT
jgi:hypothetical protein